MVLDAQNPIPLYFQLKSILEELIGSGALKPGDRIPSENKLCELYKISRTTVRQAITELVTPEKLHVPRGVVSLSPRIR